MKILATSAMHDRGLAVYDVAFAAYEPKYERIYFTLTNDEKYMICSVPHSIGQEAMRKLATIDFVDLSDYVAEPND